MSAFRMAVRWIRDRAFPLRDAAGRVILSAGVAEDVTERRQPEMQLRQARMREMIGRLAGRVAHDFNDLLSVIFAMPKICLPAVGALATRPLQSPDKPVRGSETWRIWQGAT